MIVNGNDNAGCPTRMSTSRWVSLSVNKELADVSCKFYATEEVSKKIVDLISH